MPMPTGTAIISAMTEVSDRAVDRRRARRDRRWPTAPALRGQEAKPNSTMAGQAPDDQRDDDCRRAASEPGARRCAWSSECRVAELEGVQRTGAV